MARQWKPNKLREPADGSIGGRFAGASLLSSTQPELGVGRVIRRNSIKPKAAQTIVREEAKVANMRANALTPRMF